MKIAHFDDVPTIEPIRNFRSGEISFKDLLQGEEGSADNYGLQWVTVEDAFSAPRHRHNFEQVRILIEGRFGFGPGQVQDAGSVGYFCEGTAYTQDARGRSVTLLLQVGGPSGQGFMSRRQLKAGIAALRSKGEYHDGVFTWFDKDGTKHNQDSFEATWEHMNGRRVRYPKPQYDAPVLFRPEKFRFLPVAGQPGASIRRLGRFNDHGLEIAQVNIAAGSAWTAAPAGTTRLMVCSEGRGSIDGREYRDWTSIELAKGEGATLRADADTTFWWLDIPAYVAARVDDAQAARFLETEAA